MLILVLIFDTDLMIVLKRMKGFSIPKVESIPIKDVCRKYVYVGTDG